MNLELRAALLSCARGSDIWFDEERGRPALLIEEAPIFLPRARRDGECPLSLRKETRLAVAAFKASVVTALRPAIPAGVSERHVRQYERLLAKEGGVPTHKQAEEAGALSLVWTLKEVEEARQRPPLSHLEALFESWLAKQVARDGAIIVTERRAKNELEDAAGHEVTARALRCLAVAAGFRRVHARRARLFIRP